MHRIATMAANLAVEGSVVGFNGGTSTSLTARRLAARPGLATSTHRPALTIVTNALNIATEMVLRPRIRCVSVGGVARPESYELTGPLAAMVLGKLCLDTVYLSVDGLTPLAGATCQHEGEAGINALMVERALWVVIVATGDKIGRRSFAQICSTSHISVLVTDTSAPQDVVEEFRAAGVTVEVV
jgi:DeoR family transcriptional regulator of aga operon